MGFSADESYVRVDFFKPSGKWSTTIAMKWHGYSGENLIHKTFRNSLERYVLENGMGERLDGLVAVCLEPYHEHAHPITLGLSSGCWRKKL